jgi:hypothetical protein
VVETGVVEVTLVVTGEVVVVEVPVGGVVVVVVVGVEVAELEDVEVLLPVHDAKTREAMIRSVRAIQMAPFFIYTSLYLNNFL